jgi:hypothetical protein
MRKAIALIVALLVLGACGTHDEPEYGQVTPDMPGGFSLPEPKDAEPAFAVFPREEVSLGQLNDIRNVEHVVEAASLRVARVNVGGPDGEVPLQVASTPPLEFRSVAPEPTRDADFVWTSLIGGQAVLTYEAARKLGVEGADDLDIPGLEGISVGAFAENGTPSNFADILVSDHIVDELPGEPMEILIVGADGDGDAETIGRKLKSLLPKARLLPLIQVVSGAPLASDDEPAPIAMGEAAAGLGGTMTFRILKKGWIAPDPAWIQANIVEASVPILGAVTCHRVMIPQLAGALAEIEEQGLASLIRPEDYAGCYAPRFIDRDPSLPLSNHAFGLAVDLNSDTNALGTKGDMDPRIVEIFTKWGFEWGGYWARPDPMHFELARLLPQ